MSDTERSEYGDLQWPRHEAKLRRRQWQRRDRQAIRLAMLSRDWDGADLPWRRTSGWLSH